MEDWDLHAVVRGCCSSSSSSTTTIGTTTTTTTTSIFGTNQSSDFSWFPPMDLQQQQEYDNNNNSLFTFPDLFSSNSTTLEDLEQLCKPFLPPVNLSFPIPTSSSIALPPVLQQHQHQSHQQQQQRTEQLQQQQQQHRRPLTSPTPASTPRPKRRKNQQKRTVCQVPAEGLSSDMWAWRKYGQKPIKGSPYPRGYYRCSSSKGCLARKQVERSRSDPSMFIITYTAEHNHPVPTHRNSLAGSTRHKASSTTTTTTTSTSNNNKPCASSSPTTELSPTTGLSPTTPLSIEEGGKEDEEEVEGMERVVEEEDEDEFQIPEGLMSDDLFMELDELVVPPTPSNPSTSSGQFPASFSWIATAGGS